jgi:hypothetical protein
MALGLFLLLIVVFCGKATGGGAYKYADLFKERLGVSLEKEDEMDCLVSGANFLLKVPILGLHYHYLGYILLCNSILYVMKSLEMYQTNKCFLIH